MAKGQLVRSSRAKFTAPEVNLKEIDPDVRYPVNSVEHRFLQDHCLLDPSDDRRAPVTFYLEDGTVVSNDQTFFAQQMAQQGSAMEERARAMAEDMFEQLKRQAALEAMTSQVGGEASGHVGPVPAPGKGVGSVSPAAFSSSDGSGGVDYSSYNARDLRAELSSRNLDIGGTKDEMIVRLVEDDDSKVAEQDQQLSQ